MVVDIRVLDLIEQWYVDSAAAAASSIPRHSPHAPIRHLAAKISREGGWRGFIPQRTICGATNWRYWYIRDRVWRIWSATYAQYRTGVWRTASNVRVIRVQQQQHRQ